MALDYQSEVCKLDELTLIENKNDQIISDLKNNLETKELNLEESKILLSQISLLKEKNENYTSIISKLEILIQTYFKPMSMNISPKGKEIQVERLDDSPESETLVHLKKINTEEIEENNDENYGKNLEDYIDKLNNNIELIKSAFNQNFSDNDKVLSNRIEETSIKPEDESPESHLPQKKREKSLYSMQPEIEFGNEGQRKYQSFNYLNKVNVEYALENSTFSISLLNQKIKAYPEIIKKLEEEIKQKNEKLLNASKQIEELQNSQNTLIKEISTKEEIIKIIEEKNKAFESELKEKESLVINKINEINILKNKEKKLLEERCSINDASNHYKIDNSLQDNEKEKVKDNNIIELETTQNKQCCTIF